MSTELACFACEWTGAESEAKWNDLSHFASDSFCDGQEGSGCYECPDCGELCVPERVMPDES